MRLIVIFALLAPLLSFAATADRVRLKDGSILIGTIVKTDDKGLYFETGFAGTIIIAPDQIAQITSDTDLVVELDDGGTAAVQLQAQDDTIIVTSEEGATDPAPLETVTLYSEAEYAAVTAAAIEAAKPKWALTARVGFAGASGNTDRLAFQGRFDAKRTAPNNRFNSYLEGNFAREDGAESQNEIFTGANYEQDFSDRFFAFGDVNIERDALELLNARIIASVGAGYFAIERSDTHQWQLNLGVGYRQEFFEDGTTDSAALVTLGYDYLIVLSDYLRFTHEFTYLPTLTSPLDDFRLLSNARAELPIGGSQAWALGIGVRNQFDSDPLPGNARLDTIYSVTLNYTF